MEPSLETSPNHSFLGSWFMHLLTPQSACLRDLEMIDCCVDAQTRVAQVAEIFENNPTWPGIIITQNGEFHALLSRTRCFEILGRPFGIEVFKNKPVQQLVQRYGASGLLLDADENVQNAVRAGLARPQSDIYAPIAVNFGNRVYRLLNMHHLLNTQSGLLEKLYVEVYKLSLTDPLSNLYNRRGFEENAQSLLDIARFPSKLALLRVDIDHFKLINDIYGNSTADGVIRTVASECRKALNPHDLLGRFGDDEFMVMLTETTLDQALATARRIRSHIENLVISHQGFQIIVTVSVGGAVISPEDGVYDTLLARSAQALLSAKQNGRNRIEIWHDGILLPINEAAPAGALINPARVYDDMTRGWARALELRDKETTGHTGRVTDLTLALARRFALSEVQLVDIRRGALLHDIGKVALPNGILTKPSLLTDDERALMRKHPLYACDLLAAVPAILTAQEIPANHHELWDGSGYPYGLRANDIPLSARIFTVVDVWDALTTARRYRAAWSREAARCYLAEQAGHMFDPYIVHEFLRLLDEPEPAGQPIPLRVNQTSLCL